MTTNVLHLSARDRIGGAARATYRIHRSLAEVGVHSNILAQRRTTNEESVYGLSGVVGMLYDSIRRKLDQLPLIQYRDRDPELFSPAWIPDRVKTRVKRTDPDVTHLHWVAGGFLKPATVRDLPQPVVWTLHDMWPFTGGCHYAKDCERYIESCGSCPHLGSEFNNDLSRRVFRNKSEALDGVDIRVVTPSTWLARQAERSSLLGDCPIETIPNPVDTEQFRPRESNGLRQQLGLSSEKLLIGTGANRTSRRKGMDLFFEAITELSVPASEAELVLFGRTDSAARSDTEYDLNVTGFVDDETLRRLFSELDVLIVPSRQEAFGQTASEALASGTPVVAFDTTGLSTIVTHESTGYLADPFDSADLARGIEWVVADEERRGRLGTRARTDALERFDMPVVASQYRRIYEDVLG